MSLYANINVSKAHEDEASVRRPAKSSKSAALYAGVLTNQTPPKESPQPLQPTTVGQDIRRAVEVEDEKPTEASGAKTLNKNANFFKRCNSNPQSVEFRNQRNQRISPLPRLKIQHPVRYSPLQE